MADNVKAALYAALNNNITAAGVTGFIIVYPGHPTTLDNPVFPCVTIEMQDRETRQDMIADDGRYQIDVWSKSGNDQLHEIHNQIKSIINLNPLTQGVFWLRLTGMNDDLYEPDTRTHHLAAHYKTFTM